MRQADAQSRPCHFQAQTEQIPPQPRRHCPRSFRPLYGLYHNWDRYEYLHGEVKGEIATYDWRRDCTALQVYARRPDGTGVMANTRNIYRQKSVWLDGWPIATHYANSTVLIAYDERHDRAIILQRTYGSKK